MSEVEEKSKCLYHIYNNISDQIKFCDTKTGLLLTASGIVLGVLFQLFSNLNQFKKGILIMSLTTDIASIIIFFIIIYPRIGSEEDTIFYWGNILKYKKNEYKKKINLISNDEIKNDLIGQISYLSKICGAKMHHLKFGSFMLLISILSIGVFYLIICIQT